MPRKIRKPGREIPDKPARKHDKGQPKNLGDGGHPKPAPKEDRLDTSGLPLLDPRLGKRLQPGDKFIPEDSDGSIWIKGAVYTVLRVSPAGALVRADRGRKFDFRTAEGKDVTFEAPGRAFTISLYGGHKRVSREEAAAASEAARRRGGAQPEQLPEAGPEEEKQDLGGDAS